MQKIIGVTELQRRFRSVLESVVEERTPYILTRGSRPEAALIPYDLFVRLEGLEEQQVVDRFSRLRNKIQKENARYSDEEVLADVEAELRKHGR